MTIHFNIQITLEENVGILGRPRGKRRQGSLALSMPLLLEARLPRGKHGRLVYPIWESRHTDSIIALVPRLFPFIRSPQHCEVSVIWNNSPSIP